MAKVPIIMCMGCRELIDKKFDTKQNCPKCGRNDWREVSPSKMFIDSDIPES